MADGSDGGRGLLHPYGRCTCCGEGRCAWCQIQCEHGKARMDFCGACDDEATALQSSEEQ